MKASGPAVLLLLGLAGGCDQLDPPAPAVVDPVALADPVTGRIDAAACAGRFGCAVYSNLAQQLEDPRDLWRPRPAGPADGAGAVEAIDRLRHGAVQPAAAPATRPGPDGGG